MATWAIGVGSERSAFGAGNRSGPCRLADIDHRVSSITEAASSTSSLGGWIFLYDLLVSLAFDCVGACRGLCSHRKSTGLCGLACRIACGLRYHRRTYRAPDALVTEANCSPLDPVPGNASSENERDLAESQPIGGGGCLRGLAPIGPVQAASSKPAGVLEIASRGRPKITLLVTLQQQSYPSPQCCGAIDHADRLNRLCKNCLERLWRAPCLRFLPVWPHAYGAGREGEGTARST